MENIIIDDIVVEIKLLPRVILRAVETELISYKVRHPEEQDEITDMYTRLRKTVLDILGDASRKIESYKNE
uniref:Uncharacterized protein n=1 Tax=viral metagenome TaxID=1070528 RepID=A0A6M3IJR4_9ZZZZ